MGRVFNRKKFTKRRQALRRQMPDAEVMLWSRLKGRQLYGDKFRRQYDVGTYSIDFYCPKLKASIEIDGVIKQIAFEIKKMEEAGFEQ